MLLWTSLLLAAAPIWPVEILGPQEVEHLDIDGDGRRDLRVTGGDGGSGFSEWTVCVRDGRSHALACDVMDYTPYSMFAGFRRVRSTEGPNAADPLLGSDGCEPADPIAPSQGMMWALRTAVSLDRPFQPEGPWLPGPPADQQSVCLTVQEAAGLQSGLTWNAEGADPEALAAQNWRVRYSASRPAWRSSPLLIPEDRRSPELVGEIGALTLYQLGHALALYDPAKDRHTWLVNLEGLQDIDFKYDRWRAIEDVQILGPDRIALKLSGELVGYDESLQTWIIDLGPLLARP